MDQDQQAMQPAQPTEQVGFPNPTSQEKKSNGVIKWVIVIIGVIVIVAAGIFFIMRTTDGDADAEPTPTAGTLNSFATDEPEETPTPEPTATPEPIDKSEIKIEVLNGTGTPGDAGLVQDLLEDLDFEDITADNADEQEETDTTLTYSDEIDAATIDEIVAELEETFTSVKTRKGTIAGDFDIRIVTGEK